MAYSTKLIRISSNIWLSAPAFCLLLFFATSCSSNGVSRPDAREPSFQEQVRSVQQGLTREIQSKDPINDIEFAQVQGLSSLEVLSLSTAQLSDEIADSLASLVGLKSLRLEKSPIGDRSAVAIGNLSQLTTLNLPRCGISDQGILNWPSLPNLILLRIGSPNLSDAAMETISKMNSLRFLHLMDVQISDIGLSKIHRMHQLESFYLDGGQVTDRGLSQLIEALPRLHFHRDQQHIPNDPRTDDHRKR